MKIKSAEPIYFSIVDLTLLIKKEQEIQEKENDDF
jgi:hypothetical protein